MIYDMKRLAILLGLCAAIVSCGSGPNSYYTLRADGSLPTRSGMGIGVGPVSIAEYIDRPNLVIAETEHRLGVAENHRWAGDLSSAITRVMATNLGRRWNTGSVRTYPWREDVGLSRQVSIDILQLHGEADGYAVLEASWRVYSLPDRRLVASRTFSGREALTNDGYDALASAESRLLARLAGQITSRP